MRIIITGATSFVGSAVLREALEQGHDVTAIGRPDSTKLRELTNRCSSEISEGKLHIYENNLSDPEKLLLLLKGPYDVFCHFGWGGSGSDARTDTKLQEKNVRDSLRTIDTAKILGCSRFFFAGSQAEYGLYQQLMTEDLPCSPRSAYGEAKLKMRIEGEKRCREKGMRYLHGRIFSAYGPGDHPWTLVESCLDHFTKGEAMSLGACSQQWNFLYADDLGKAIVSLITADEENFSGMEDPVFNLAGSETRPLREFVTEIHEICCSDSELQYGTRAENAEGVINLIPSIEKIRSVTGWSPEITFREGIIRMLAMRK